MRCSTIMLLVFLVTTTSPAQQAVGKKANILFAISDDQSFPHTSFAGATFIQTPAFDRLAERGIYFSNCLAGSPGCAPSRSTIVTGRYHWQNEQAGQHAAGWLSRYRSFVDILAEQGYHTGYTGKGVGPFQYGDAEQDSLRVQNAAGPAYSTIRYEEGTSKDERYASGIRNLNYAANFNAFLEDRPGDKPFFFWYGASEPHRAYEEGSGLRRGKKMEDAQVPGFLPDCEVVRSDLLDYAVEIEWFDLHLGRMLETLDSLGELENTIIIVTADNGMPFPRAKANGYEYGIHVPLLVSAPGFFPGGRRVDDLVSFADLAPTIFELTQTSSEGMLPMSGRSMVPLLESEQHGFVDPKRQYAFSGRERHSSSRYRNLGYPQRMIRDSVFLLIWNMRPERWPAGAPRRLAEDGESVLPLYGLDSLGKHHSEWAFTDVDACPTKTYLVEHHHLDSVRPFFDWSYAKRPEFELYDIHNDADCLVNLADDPDFEATERRMQAALVAKLRETGDPRLVGPDTEIFDSYPRYSRMRFFPKPDWWDQ